MRVRSTIFACIAATLMLGSSLQAAGKPAITKPKLDPDAPVVEMFKGMEDGQIDVTLIQKSATNGNLIVENKTKEALTVQLPEAFAGVHVLNQFGQLGGGGGQLGGGGQQGGGGQSTGGGAQGLGGGGQLGGGGAAGGGAGFFSIPPEKVVRLPVKSVCLEYGKRDPVAKMKYKVVPVEKVSTDPVLHQLLALVRTGRVNEDIAQAAAWHIANGKSFRELAQMRKKQPGKLPDVPLFNYAVLQRADMLVATAKTRAKEAEKKGDTKTPVTPETPKRRGSR